MVIERQMIIVASMFLLALALFVLIGESVPQDFEVPEWVHSVLNVFLGLAVSLIVIGGMLAMYSKRRFKKYSDRVAAIEGFDFQGRYFSVDSEGSGFMRPFAQKRRVRQKEKVLVLLEEYIADNDDVSTAIAELNEQNKRNDLSRTPHDPRFKKGYGVKDRSHPEGTKVQYLLEKSVLGEGVYADMRELASHDPVSYAGDKIGRRKMDALREDDRAQVEKLCDAVIESEHYGFVDFMNIICSGTEYDRRLLKEFRAHRHVATGRPSASSEPLVSVENIRAKHFSRVADKITEWKKEEFFPEIDVLIAMVENEMDSYTDEIREEVRNRQEERTFIMSR